MRPLISLFFRRSVTTDADDAAHAVALGAPSWGAGALLRDLELRLGLPSLTPSHAVRVQCWSERMDRLARTAPVFYARSYDVDPVGTARTLLAWRDALVGAGWNGERLPDGGPRLDALHDLEELSGDLPPGVEDRLRAVERELGSTTAKPYQDLRLAEPSAVWPGRWQRVFRACASLGTRVAVEEGAQACAEDVDSDLGYVQSLLSGRSAAPRALRGDGSVVVLRAETAWELGQGVAGVLRGWGAAGTVVVRGGDVASLEAGWQAHGLASQGSAATSAWRPVLQVLPLALELAFAPCDPFRVFDLASLPAGPLDGLIGRELTRALAKAPGVGGRPWKEAKALISQRVADAATRTEQERGASEAECARVAAERVAAAMATIATWTEQPGADPIAGAPTGALLAVTSRVEEWLTRRLTRARIDESESAGNEHAAVSTLTSAVAQAQALREALTHEARPSLELVEIRQLIEQVCGAGHCHHAAREGVGRVDHVDDPASVRHPRDTVVWWHAVAGSERRVARSPWRHRELEALRSAGLVLFDPVQRLAAEARSWRGAVLAARKRLVLAIPRHHLGSTCEPHPIWDEVAARLPPGTSPMSAVTVDLRDLLSATPHPLASALSLATVETPTEPLPAARAEWTLPAGSVELAQKHSASSLEVLTGCPLRWVLRYRAGLRPGSLAAVPKGPLLYGTLAHRVVEDLHKSGALIDAERVVTETGSVLDQLVATEGAVLLRPGMAFELAQLQSQIGHALRTLSKLLIDSDLSVVDVESQATARWGSRTLEGRLDLLLSGGFPEVVLDLKWGRKSYEDRLQKGLAIQLAVYAEARRGQTGSPILPLTAYYSLSRAQVLTTEPHAFVGVRSTSGPSTKETWQRVARTAELAERLIGEGRIAVTGVAHFTSLLEMASLPEADAPKHLTADAELACQYCSYGPLCGRSWEAYS